MQILRKRSLQWTLPNARKNVLAGVSCKVVFNYFYILHVKFHNNDKKGLADDKMSSASLF